MEQATRRTHGPANAGQPRPPQPSGRAGAPATGFPGVLLFAMLGAVVLGGVGFVGGFFGPLLLTPGASQGPLLGLLITGPLGVGFGAIGGALYGILRRPRS